MSATPPASPSASASPASAATQPSLPTKAEIVAEFGERRPSAWGLDLPGIVRRLDSPHVHVTFDACGGPGGSRVDTELLNTLRRYQVPATLFLNLRWIQANEDLAKSLASDKLFRLESHGGRHVPLSVAGRSAYGIAGTANVAELYDELTAADGWFQRHLGRRPAWFRSGTAHVDDIAVAVAGRLGYRLAGFAVNVDQGATATKAQVKDALGAAKPGDVLIAHMNRPGRHTAEGVAAALPGLLARGVTFSPMP